ncbi:hypothetical protein QAD02_014637 [Eretmocerus hayati]|uniref:Uncharacterized protein n=1 Tax=Eretmocerus hayati TaxID=131215 RepID=A0ACC2P5I8_9HYME|nr:hypothetical protein QAD02_014637 [Eretmocerus hayati]
MTQNFEHCIKLLRDNEESVREEAERIIIKLCNNILRNPEELKYRKIKLSNPLVISKLLPAAGAIESLFEAGFVENDDEFLLPLHASMLGIERLHSILNKNVTSPKYDQPSSNDRMHRQKNLLSPSRELGELEDYKKKSFLATLSHHLHDVLRYEDPNLQNKVKQILPLEILEINSMKKLREIQRESKLGEEVNDVVFEDVFLIELLSWFKLKFFQWVDSPMCNRCGGKCSHYRDIVSPDPKVSRVEIHRCTACGSKTNFPRYTDPEVLLSTRKGRCGEWANCFTLICRTVGYDARLVYDKTDHVWTEVWSIAHNRWIHADACENVMDRPLIYEKGWGKELSYIIAFSKDEMQDVTWRYTRKFKEVMERRNLCSEMTLSLFIQQLNLKHQTREGYSIARRKFVAKRSALELAQMLVAPPGFENCNESSEADSQYSGRTSGSLAWRISRGETSATALKSMKWCIPQDVLNFEMTYSIVDDTYTAKDLTQNEILDKRNGWNNGIESVSGGIFRKEEADWKMVYLARSPNSKTASICWAFTTVIDANVCIDTVYLNATVATFHSASVRWEVEGILLTDGGSKKERKNVSLQSEHCQTEDLRGASEIFVKAILSGGEGESAWQHAQLFRQNLNPNDPTKVSLTVRVNLMKRFDKKGELSPVF